MLENICTSARCAMSLCGTYFTPVQTYNISLPFTTTHVERMFSSLKLIKTDRRTNMSNTTLSDLMEVYHEGPTLEDFHNAAVLIKASESNTEQGKLQSWPKTIALAALV